MRINAIRGYLQGLPAGTDWRAVAAGLDELLPSTMEEALRPTLVQVERMRQEEGEKLVLFPDQVHQTREMANGTLVKSWVRDDISGALAWFENVSNDGRESGSNAAEIRSARVAAILGGRLADDPDGVLDWVQEQAWEWERSDLIPRALLAASPDPNISTALLTSIRSEELRFEFLREFAHVSVRESRARDLDFHVEESDPARSRATKSPGRDLLFRTRAPMPSPIPEDEGGRISRELRMAKCWPRYKGKEDGSS